MPGRRAAKNPVPPRLAEQPRVATDGEIRQIPIEELVYFSDVLKCESGNKTVEYRVKSVIHSEENRFIISYKSLVLDIVSMREIEDEPVGYDDDADTEAEPGYHIKTGWTQHHKVECKPVEGKGLDCMKDQTYAINLVEG